jgi:phage terminase small subunit
MFTRSDDYMFKITMEALDKEVILDAIIEIRHGMGKLKAYCTNTKTYVQFPTALRKEGKRFCSDVIKSGGGGRAIFYRAFKTSIRENDKDGKVVA